MVWTIAKLSITNEFMNFILHFSRKISIHRAAILIAQKSDQKNVKSWIKVSIWLTAWSFFVIVFVSTPSSRLSTNFFTCLKSLFSNQPTKISSIWLDYLIFSSCRTLRAYFFYLHSFLLSLHLPMISVIYVFTYKYHVLDKCNNNNEIKCYENHDERWRWKKIMRIFS